MNVQLLSFENFVLLLQFIQKMSIFIMLKNRVRDDSLKVDMEGIGRPLCSGYHYCTPSFNKF